MKIAEIIWVKPDSNEEASHTTQQERGLAFICYQTNLNAGFAFLQNKWANAISFPPQHNLIPSTKNVNPGYDPLIGNSPTENKRVISGLYPQDLGKSEDMDDFVIAKGGEYFFMPSIATLKNIADQKDLNTFA
jgi:deferrochelatase/peroxidase EfeB